MGPISIPCKSINCFQFWCFIFFLLYLPAFEKRGDLPFSGFTSIWITTVDAHPLKFFHGQYFTWKACLFLKPLYCIHREKQVPGTPEFWLFNDLILTSIWSMKKNPAAILSQNSSENLISFLMLWVNKNMGGNSEETTYQTDKMPWHWWQISWKGF